MESFYRRGIGILSTSVTQSQRFLFYMMAELLENHLFSDNVPVEAQTDFWIDNGHVCSSLERNTKSVTMKARAGLGKHMCRVRDETQTGQR